VAETDSSEAPPRSSRARRRRTSDDEAPTPAAAPAAAEPPAPRAPRRATLSSERRRLIRLRDQGSRVRPVFGRQAANRYGRIGRDGAWRRPRGLQSKQRRHYGYRPRVVRIGYRGPAAVRGLTPAGFRPILVRTGAEIEALDPATEAAVIARTVGTRRRLTLEDVARRKGIHVVNPIVTSEREA